MKNKTWRRWSQGVSTVKKSVANIWGACWRTNWRQVLWLRGEEHAGCGGCAGSSPPPCERSESRALVPRRECAGSPSPGSLGELKDQLPPLRVAGRAWAWRASVEGGRLAPDQIAVPAEQGLCR